MLYPLLLEPVYKDYIWGGERLKTDFGKNADISPLAESWELACHRDGTNTILNGPCKGWRLDRYLKEFPGALGSKAQNSELPIMVKLIDAADNLSIQVHPDDEYAMKIEGCRGKTEMWYVIDCEPGASLIYGFKRSITKEEFKKRIEDGTLLEVVNMVQVKKGDTFYIPAGTLHAIGKGCLIAEIQQNSNITYRVFDYGRLGKDGKPRALHINKAIDVTQLTKTAMQNNVVEILCHKNLTETPLRQFHNFAIKIAEVTGDSIFMKAENEYIHLLCLSGGGFLRCEDVLLAISKGTSILIPAEISEFLVSGNLKFIKTTIHH